MFDRKPVENRFIKETMIRSEVKFSWEDSTRMETEVKGKKEYFSLIPGYMRLFEEKHGKICISIFRKDEYYVMGYSICGRKDSFCKKTAIEVAADRAYRRLATGEVKDSSQYILPTEKDLERIPSQHRKKFVNICTELFNKYSIK